MQPPITYVFAPKNLSLVSLDQVHFLLSADIESSRPHFPKSLVLSTSTVKKSTFPLGNLYKLAGISSSTLVSTLVALPFTLMLFRVQSAALNMFIPSLFEPVLSHPLNKCQAHRYMPLVLTHQLHASGFPFFCFFFVCLFVCNEYGWLYVLPISSSMTESYLSPAIHPYVMQPSIFQEANPFSHPCQPSFKSGSD